MKGYIGEVQNGLMKLYSDPGIARMVAEARERQAANGAATAEATDTPTARNTRKGFGPSTHVFA